MGKGRNNKKKAKSKFAQDATDEALHDFLSDLMSPINPASHDGPRQHGLTNTSIPLKNNGPPVVRSLALGPQGPELFKEFEEPSEPTKGPSGPMAAEPCGPQDSILMPDANVPMTSDGPVGASVAVNPPPQPEAVSVDKLPSATPPRPEAVSGDKLPSASAPISTNAPNSTSDVPDSMAPIMPPLIAKFKDKRPNDIDKFPLRFVQQEEERVVLEPAEIFLDSSDGWKVNMLGCFAGRYPGHDALQALVDSWGVPCHFIFKPKGWTQFQFKSVEDKDKVMTNGPYSRFNKRLFLKDITEDHLISDSDFDMVPLWVRLPGLPANCWHHMALSKIASQLGEPFCMDRDTRAGKASEARVLINVNTSSYPRDELSITLPNGRAFVQKFIYEFYPGECLKCGNKFHFTEFCKGKIKSRNKGAKPSGKHLPTSYASAVSGCLDEAGPSSSYGILGPSPSSIHQPSDPPSLGELPTPSAPPPPAAPALIVCSPSPPVASLHPPSSALPVVAANKRQVLAAPAFGDNGRKGAVMGDSGRKGAATPVCLVSVPGTGPQSSAHHASERPSATEAESCDKGQQVTAASLNSGVEPDSSLRSLATTPEPSPVRGVMLALPATDNSYFGPANRRKAPPAVASQLAPTLDARPIAGPTASPLSTLSAKATPLVGLAPVPSGGNLEDSGGGWREPTLGSK